MYCTRVLLQICVYPYFLPLPLPILPVYSISHFCIPKVCMEVWPAVCLFPENQINKEQPTRQSIHREAGSINISYVQLSQTVHTTHCINWSRRSRVREIKCSPRVTYLHIDHINVWTVSISISNSCVYCFYISVKQMRKKSYEAPRLWLNGGQLVFNIQKLRTGPALWHVAGTRNTL